MWILLLILGTGPCLAGCKRMTDVTCEPVFQEPLCARYELVKDVLVCRSDETVVPLYLAPAGGGAEKPVTVKDYLESPEHWMETEAYRNRYGNPRVYYVNVVGYLPEGTRLRVVKVFQVHNRALGPVFVPVVRVDSQQFGECLIDGGSVFWVTTCDDMSLRPCPPLLRRVEN